jgi:transglutaminase-like putative cysteine protease
MGCGHTLSARWVARCVCVLLFAVARAVSAACEPASDDSPLQDIARTGEAFVRAAAVPAWADLLVLPPSPSRGSRVPSVVRLWETQLLVGPTPVQLTQRVVQVNHASALGEIGQLSLEFNPQFERLLLHKVQILRGSQTIDHTRSALVRFLQREAKLEQGVYTGVITVAVVLPGVRVGDTLQLVYSIVGESPALRARYSHRVQWDQANPVALRRVTLVVPAERRVRWRWVGGAGGDGPDPAEAVNAGMRRLRFEGRDLAAVVVEAMMPPRAQALRRLYFSEYADWNEVARWAQQLFPTGAPLPDDMAPLIARLRALSDPEDRASQALQWVQSEVRHWSALLGEFALRPQLPAVVVRRGWGDCKGKALLLSSMLRELGIDARPALASLATRDGPASMLPSPDLFDHVIVQARLAGREYYLDPTNQGQVGLLSRMGQRLEGAAVLPVDADTKDLAIVRSPNRTEIFGHYLHERLSLAQIGATGRLEVDIRWVGATAESLRLALLHMGPAELRQFVAGGYLQQYDGSRLLGEPEVSDDRELNQLTIRANFAVPGLAQRVPRGWTIGFAPGLADVIDMPSQLGRRFPLALSSFPVTYHYRVDMTWPDGMTIDDGPASPPFETPHFKLLMNRSVRGNTETRTIEFTTKVSEVPPDEVLTYVSDLASLQARIGGVMMASYSK